jgi:beta-barrel assembly-enhancing protease
MKTGQLGEAGQTLAPLLSKAPEDIVYNLAQIELDMAANRLDAAQRRQELMFALYPSNYPLQQAHIDLLLKQQRTREAERALDELLKNRAKDPDVWYQVAEVRGLSGNTIGLHQARAEFFALVGDYNQAIEQLDFAKRRASNNFQLASRLDARQRELAEEKRLVEQMLR